MLALGWLVFFRFVLCYRQELKTKPRERDIGLLVLSVTNSWQWRNVPCRVSCETANVGFLGGFRRGIGTCMNQGSLSFPKEICWRGVLLTKDGERTSLLRIGIWTGVPDVRSQSTNEYYSGVDSTRYLS